MSDTTEHRHSLVLDTTSEEPNCPEGYVYCETCLEGVPASTEHRVTVINDGGKFVVDCDYCGTVGNPCGDEYEVNAQAIAARHTEINGFERVSS